MTHPDCLNTSSCSAKGAGVCRRCSGVRLARRSGSDPAMRAASRARLIAINRDPAMRAKMVASMMANPQAVASLAASGKRAGDALRASPEAEARRQAASLAAIPQRVARQAQATAKRVNIPLALVSEYRQLRRSGMPKEQARGVLARSYPSAFAAMHEAFLAKHRRIIDRRPEARTC